MTAAQRAAAQISDYLLTGMHHSTTEARKVMEDIITVAGFHQGRESALVNAMADRLADLSCPHCHEPIGTTLEIR